MMTQTAKRLIDIQEVKRAYDSLVAPGQVIELRALEAIIQGDRRALTYSGYFDNFQSLQNALKQLTSALGIYLTLQPCMPDLLARKAGNKILPAGRDATTPDKYITAYRWLLIDCDPDRVSGTSSTDEEHGLALTHSKHITQELAVLGFPDPIQADSGNGAHLLYRIDLEVKESDLVKRVLAGLAERYNLPAIHIDQTVFNPSRICKLYGTLACKGGDTDQRPYRMSYIVDAPEHLEIVPRELLEVIAMSVPASLQTASPQKAILPYQQQHTESFTAETFLQKHHISVKRSDPYNGGTRYLLEHCVWDSSHTDNSACVYQFADGRLGASCSHDSCSNKGWKELRLVFEPDAYTIKSPRKQTKTVTSEETAEKQEKEPPAYIKLMQICEQAHYVITPDGSLYARVSVNGHYEVVAISERGSGFRRWLTYEYKKLYGLAPNSDALSLVMSGVQADAEYTGEHAEVHTRMAFKQGCVYLDLANEQWECVEISPQGWRVIACPPVYFRRPSGMLPLPYPQQQPCGSLFAHLRKLINTKEEKDLVLITAWLVGTLHPTGPYPVLNLNGPRGSMKSTATAFLRNLVDPNSASTRNAPKDDRDAAISAQNSMIIALDNLSSIQLWLSDFLCKLSTGSGLGTRALYSDGEEKVFNFKRPIILNGIEDGLITQGDLLNRAILVTLEPPDEYVTEETVKERFIELHPKILGSLLTVASIALRDRRKVTLLHPPRMADFAHWITAAEPALKWESGTFMNAYTENLDNSSSIVVESSPVAKAILQYMSDNSKGWNGLVGGLHDALSQYDVYKQAKTAPKAPNKLTGQLKRIAPSMKIQGIDIHQPPRMKNGSHVTIKYLPGVDRLPSGVDRLPSGVDRLPSGVDRLPSGVDKKNLSTPMITPDLEPIQNTNGFSGVDGVDKIPVLSALYPPQKEKKEEKEDIADRERNLSTPSTLPTSASYSNAYLNQLIKDLDGYLKTLPREDVMWVGPDTGIRNGYVSKQKYVEQIKECWRSGDEKRVKAAVNTILMKLGREGEIA